MVSYSKRIRAWLLITLAAADHEDGQLLLADIFSVSGIF